jgi:DNA-binding NarL/FixJ family response regulator
MEIELIIVEDDREIRETLVNYFNKDSKRFSKVISFQSVEELLDSEQPLEKFIVLLDINLPGISGIEGIFPIKSKWLNCEIIMLSVQSDSANIFKAICAGASGYIEKGTSLMNIKEALIALNEGGSPITPSIARKIVDYFQPSKNLTEHLSPREDEVVKGLIDGLSYKLIAARLDVSIDTIRKHIKNIYGKLQINSKGELLAKYHQKTI